MRFTYVCPPLQATLGVDKVVLLGHSLGGYVAPVNHDTAVSIHAVYTIMQLCACVHVWACMVLFLLLVVVVVAAVLVVVVVHECVRACVRACVHGVCA